MGRMGRFIDGLQPEQKDRLIQAQGWGWAGKIGKENDNERYSGLEGRLCLMDNACGRGSWMKYDVENRDKEIRKPPAIAFDRACDKFGLQRIVRCIKLRASKPQPVLMASPQQQILQHTNTPAEV